MKKLNLDILKHLLSGYLHQDWNCDYQTWKEAVETFLRACPSEEIGQLGDQLRQLLDMPLSEAALEEMVYGQLGCEYEPGPEQSVREWLTEMETQIRKQSDKGADVM
jgi:hypothetical protein